MLIRAKGYNDGAQEYLEKGNKAGRELSRDELDERVILHGDLDLTRMIYQSIPNVGQSRYTTYTLSFREDVVPEELLHKVTDEFRRFLLHAYREHEINFYAEAHIPKIKEVTDKRTGERIERKPHIHVIVPRVNLMSGLEANPGGMHTMNEKYFEAFQEYINQKYGLSSPREHIRVDPNNAASVLSRYKGDDFNAKNREFKQELVKQIVERNIRTRESFYQLVSEYGETRIRNKGKEGEYLAVKLPGDAKSTNLKESIFSEAFIVDRQLSKPPLDKAVIERRLGDWTRVSREIKYVSKATPSFREKYKQASPEQRAAVLKHCEQKFYLVNGEPHERKPRPQRARDNRRSPSQAHTGRSKETAEGLQGLSGRPLADHGQPEQPASALLLPTDARIHLGHEGADRDPGLRTPVPTGRGRGASTSGRRHTGVSARPEGAGPERRDEPGGRSLQPRKLTLPPALRNPHKLQSVGDIERHGERLFGTLERDPQGESVAVDTAPGGPRRRRPAVGPRQSKLPPYAQNPNRPAAVADIDLNTQRLFASLERTGPAQAPGQHKPRGALLDRYKAKRSQGLPLYARNPNRVASVADIQAQSERLFASVREAPTTREAEPIIATSERSSRSPRVAKGRLKTKRLPPYALNKLRSAQVSDIEAHSRRLFDALSTTGSYRYFSVERLKPMAINKSASTVAAYLNRQLDADHLSNRQRAAIRRVDRKFYEVRHFLFEDHRLDRKDRAQLLSILSFERMKAREAITQPVVYPEDFSMEASQRIKALLDDDTYPDFSISAPPRHYAAAEGSISGASAEQATTIKGRVQSILEHLSKRLSPDEVAKNTRELDESNLYAKKARFSSNVHYIDKTSDKTVFVDTGKHIALRRTGMTESGVALALKMAKDRFGSTLAIHGSAEFKKLIVEAAAKQNMDVHFTDKAMNRALQERKAELAIEREAETIEPAAPASPTAQTPAGPNLTIIKFNGGTQVDFNSIDDLQKTLREIAHRTQKTFEAKQELLRQRAGIKEELKQELPDETRKSLSEKLDDMTMATAMFESDIKNLADDRDLLSDRIVTLQTLGLAQPAERESASAQPAAAIPASPELKLMHNGEPAQLGLRPANPDGAGRDEQSVQGVLLEHGAAPYQHDSKNDPSYFVSLKTQDGEKTLWGVGLKDAMAAHKLKPGERISLIDLGTQPVTVARRQPDGSKVDVNSARREWKVSALDAPKLESSFLAEQLAKTLASTGLTRSEYLQEPNQAVNLAKFHAANIVTGSDASVEGKQLVVELMRDPTYRETFAAEVTTYFNQLPDHHKAQAQKFVGDAQDLLDQAAWRYGGAAPAVEVPSRSTPEPVSVSSASVEGVLPAQTASRNAAVPNQPQPAATVVKSQPGDTVIRQVAMAAPVREQSAPPQLTPAQANQLDNEWIKYSNDRHAQVDQDAKNIREVLTSTIVGLRDQFKRQDMEARSGKGLSDRVAETVGLKEGAHVFQIAELNRALRNVDKLSGTRLEATSIYAAADARSISKDDWIAAQVASRLTANGLQPASPSSQPPGQSAVYTAEREARVRETVVSMLSQSGYVNVDTIFSNEALAEAVNHVAELKRELTPQQPQTAQVTRDEAVSEQQAAGPVAQVDRANETVVREVPKVEVVEYDDFERDVD